MKAIDGLGTIIRPLQAWHEYLAAEELQRTVWQMPDWRDVVPANLLITAHKNGGILLGAFAPNDQLVGFAFSFLGATERVIATEARQDLHRTWLGRNSATVMQVSQNSHAEIVSSRDPSTSLRSTQDALLAMTPTKILKQCSHMLAVLPEFQGQKIGERLKFAQRQAALAQEVALITWTYDPLLALNAMLNLVRLGAIARHYRVSAYGDMTDGLNAGLPSDRFEVEWWLNAPRVQSRAVAPPPRDDWDALMRSGAQKIFDVTFDANDLPCIERVSGPEGDTLLLEIPANLGALKSTDAALANDWRMRTRAAFQKYFDAGYAAVSFVFDAQQKNQRAAYVLTRSPIDLGVN